MSMSFDGGGLCKKSNIMKKEKKEIIAKRL